MTVIAIRSRHSLPELFAKNYIISLPSRTIKSICIYISLKESLVHFPCNAIGKNLLPIRRVNCKTSIYQIRNHDRYDNRSVTR